jgi:hypothetical protein
MDSLGHILHVKFQFKYLNFQHIDYGFTCDGDMLVYNVDMYQPRLKFHSNKKISWFSQ